MYLSAAQVAAMISAERRVGPRTVQAWTTRGVKIRGRAQRIRLGSVQLPFGRRWTEAHVLEFVDALTCARDAADGAVKGHARRVTARAEARGHGLKLCQPEQVGTYPPAVISSRMRGAARPGDVTDDGAGSGGAAVASPARHAASARDRARSGLVL